MDLRSVFEQYGVPVAPEGHRHVRAGWVGIDCPSCSPGWGKFRLGFNIASGRASCWICGKQDAAQTLAEVCRISLGEAIGILQDRTRGHFATEDRPTGILKLPSSAELLTAHRRYLEDRRFDPDEIVKTWGISGIGPVGEFKWRILIPICDIRGKVVSWTTRSILRSEPLRYRSAGLEEESVPHKDILYGAHLARHTAVIQEGPIDAWTIGPGAVATCGLGFSDKQMAAMAAYSVRVVCFDATPDAQKRAYKLCRDLSALPGVTENLYLETGKDSNEADPEEILELRQKYLIQS